ncbi:hypothetical protein C8R43DRAFT_1005876 [Mycena crocata]|nr:hypothetical protein C8R43DRAFT_1005876 [Mycena crocata]
MFQNLCVELIQEIGSKVDRADLKRLRATCRGFSSALGPLYFSTFVLTSNRLHLQETVTTLRELVAGEVGWSHYAKTLVIRPGREPRLDEPGCDLSIAEQRCVLAAALGCMERIRTVCWQMDDDHPLWALNVVCAFLNTLPLLEDLQLTWWPTDNIHHNLPLAQVTTLRKLTIKSRYRDPTLASDQVCALVYQNRGLTSLHLLGGEAAWWFEVWTMLRDQPNLNIRLKDVCTDMLTADLLVYLSSYSGLERLQYRRTHSGTHEQADALADFLYTSVLPRHADSLVCLRDLDSLTTTGTRWGLGQHNVETIARLQRLETLEMCVKAVDVLHVDLPHNAIHLLLQTATNLPRLQFLGVWHYWYSGAGAQDVGTSGRYLPSAVGPAIRTAVQGFRVEAKAAGQEQGVRYKPLAQDGCNHTRVPPPPVVLADRVLYTPEREGGATSKPDFMPAWRYREVSVGK